MLRTIQLTLMLLFLPFAHAQPPQPLEGQPQSSHVRILTTSPDGAIAMCTPIDAADEFLTYLHQFDLIPEKHREKLACTIRAKISTTDLEKINELMRSYQPDSQQPVEAEKLNTLLKKLPRQVRHSLKEYQEKWQAPPLAEGSEVKEQTPHLTVLIPNNYIPSDSRDETDETVVTINQSVLNAASDSDSNSFSFESRLDIDRWSQWLSDFPAACCGQVVLPILVSLTLVGVPTTCVGALIVAFFYSEEEQSEISDKFKIVVFVAAALSGVCSLPSIISNSFQRSNYFLE